MQGTRVSYQSGLDADCRSNFTRNGYLNQQQDQSRSISDGSTVFALAYELFNITATQAPVVWAIGFTTDLAINYTDLSGAPPILRSPYYKTRYSTDEEMVSIYNNSRGEICLISNRRCMTSLTISAMRPQEPNSWRQRYSGIPILSQSIFPV